MKEQDKTLKANITYLQLWCFSPELVLPLWTPSESLLFSSIIYCYQISELPAMTPMAVSRHPLTKRLFYFLLLLLRFLSSKQKSWLFLSCLVSQEVMGRHLGRCCRDIEECEGVLYKGASPHPSFVENSKSYFWPCCEQNWEKAVPAFIQLPLALRSFNL